MEENSKKTQMPLIDKLRNGEIIECVKCHKGHYVTDKKYITISHEFNCNNCGSPVRVTPNIIVD